MKKNAIIPIFIPHMGCPFDCIFCNQGQITARGKPASRESIVSTIDLHLSTIENAGMENIEIAFYGGSFTGLSIPLQQEYLSIAKDYKDKGRINGIRLSTRPDYIDDEILANLKAYGVDLIELGVQSFDDDVLVASQRGHSKEIVYESSALIKSYGFKLGIQLMIGLPADSHDKSVNSAIETARIAPDVARIYPTIVIKGTGLETLLLEGKYTALPLDEAVRTAKDMYLILQAAGVSVIRMGLKSSDNIADGKSILGSTFHPAFRQLVESLVAREDLERQLLLCLSNRGFNKQEISSLESEIDSKSACAKGEDQLLSCKSVSFFSRKESLSNMVGNKGSNRDYFQNKYPGINFSFKVDNTLEIGEYVFKLD
jgi:histone acetyltransferase (RNA polymerase elongator complex component)